MAEEQHEKGRNYVNYFNGLLTLTFGQLNYTKNFDAYKNPTRLAFNINHEKFSFDMKGTIDYNGEKREVWIESKGYLEGSKLLTYYKDFIIKAYQTILAGKTNEDDLFFFVTNVPFGCSIKNLFNRSFIEEVLEEKKFFEYKTDKKFTKFSESIFGIIFTDSHINLLTEKYTIKPGDNLWELWRRRKNRDLGWEEYQEMMLEINNNIQTTDKLPIGRTIKKFY